METDRLLVDTSMTEERGDSVAAMNVDSSEPSALTSLAPAPPLPEQHPRQEAEPKETVAAAETLEEPKPSEAAEDLAEEKKRQVDDVAQDYMPVVESSVERAARRQSLLDILDLLSR